MPSLQLQPDDLIVLTHEGCVLQAPLLLLFLLGRHGGELEQQPQCLKKLEAVRGAVCAGGLAVGAGHRVGHGDRQFATATAQAQVGLSGVHVEGTKGARLGEGIQHEGAFEGLLVVTLGGAEGSPLLLALLVAVLFWGLGRPGALSPFLSLGRQIGGEWLVCKVTDRERALVKSTATVTIKTPV